MSAENIEHVFQDICNMASKIQREAAKCIDKFKQTQNLKVSFQELTHILKLNYDYVKQNAANLKQLILRASGETDSYISHLDVLEYLISENKKHTESNNSIDGNVVSNQNKCTAAICSNVKEGKHEDLALNSQNSDFDKETVANLSFHSSPSSIDSDQDQQTDAENTDTENNAGKETIAFNPVNEFSQSSFVFNTETSFDKETKHCDNSNDLEKHYDQGEKRTESEESSEGNNGEVLLKLIANYFKNKEGNDTISKNKNADNYEDDVNLKEPTYSGSTEQGGTSGDVEDNIIQNVLQKETSESTLDQQKTRPYSAETWSNSSQSEKLQQKNIHEEHAEVNHGSNSTDGSDTAFCVTKTVVRKLSSSTVDESESLHSESPKIRHSSDMDISDLEHFVETSSSVNKSEMLQEERIHENINNNDGFVETSNLGDCWKISNPTLDGNLSSNSDCHKSDKSIEMDISDEELTKHESIQKFTNKNISDVEGNIVENVTSNCIDMELSENDNASAVSDPKEMDSESPDDKFEESDCTVSVKSNRDENRNDVDEINMKNSDVQLDFEESPEKLTDTGLVDNTSVTKDLAANSSNDVLQVESMFEEIAMNITSSTGEIPIIEEKSTQQVDDGTTEVTTSTGEGAQLKNVEESVKSTSQDLENDAHRVAKGDVGNKSGVDGDDSMKTNIPNDDGTDQSDSTSDSDSSNSKLSASYFIKTQDFDRFKLDERKRDELLDMLTKCEEDRHRQELKLVPDSNTKKESEEDELVSNSNEDSETELYDVTREEEVTFSNHTSKKKLEAKAWDAFQSLLEEDDISFDSDDEDNTIDSIEEDFIISRKDTALTDLKTKFNIDKELTVLIEYCDMTYYQTEYRKESRNSNSRTDNVIDRLCDLSTVLRKRKRKSSVRGSPIKRTRKHSASLSITSDDSLVGMLDSEQSSDNGATNSQFLEDPDDAQSALATALWNNIKNSSDELFSDNESDDNPNGQKKSKTSRKKPVTRQISESSSDSAEGDDSGKLTKRASSWRLDPLLREVLSSDDDTEESDQRAVRRKRREIQKKQMLSYSSSSDTDSDATILLSAKSEWSDSNKSDASQTKDDEANEITENIDSPSKKAKGRRNIRALMKDDDLALSTQQANEEEKARIKRLEEKQKTLGSQSVPSSQDQEDIEPLVLDCSENIEIKVTKNIVKQLKPHQREGIRFMWDSCYESIAQMKRGWAGSGCILAHCMGLGKTRQAIALVHTLYSCKVTNTKHVLVVCPLSTVPNWHKEYKLTLRYVKEDAVPVHTIQNRKQSNNRFSIVKKWQQTGGILIMGYEAFGHMTNDDKLDRWEEQGLCIKTEILSALVSPGPDLIICDEGHLLRNKQTQRSLSLNKVRTKRRIVLTGTPLQNNLMEYYCMTHFVKPNLLGTEREFKTNFVHPITNGQYEDSTSTDILLMKQRTHVLHKMLAKTVQRLEDTELKRYLPKLIDHALFLNLSETQVRLYNTYLDDAIARPHFRTTAGNINRKNLLADVSMLDYICTHPYLLELASKTQKIKLKERDTIVDDGLEEVEAKYDWCKDLLPADVSEKTELGTKIQIVLELLEQAQLEGDKVLIFSQTYVEMNALEHFIRRHLNYIKSVNYLRMDGTTLPEDRTIMCNKFNDRLNSKLQLFLMSTKVGGLGLNLTAANRVIIMTVNWNPSYDVQSIFRTYRFGQTKIVYVYRLITKDTMEERRYNRQITKLAIAHRVIDRYQITRHYNFSDIRELYAIRPKVQSDRPIPKVPEDSVLAKMIRKWKFIHKWHEHQNLLANRPEEDLNEQQKEAAWEDFNRKDVPSPTAATLHGLHPNALPTNSMRPPPIHRTANTDFRRETPGIENELVERPSCSTPEP